MTSETEAQLLQLRVADLEAQVKFLYHHLKIDPTRPQSADPILSPEVQDALRGGNKIAAIKIYRELANCGLAEAKEAIERAELS